MIEIPKKIHPDALKASQNKHKVESTLGKPIFYEDIEAGLNSSDPQTRQESAGKIWAITPIDKIPELMMRAIEDEDPIVQLNALEGYFSTPICLNDDLFTKDQVQAFIDRYESIRPKEPTNPTRSNLNSLASLSILNIKF